MSQLRYIMLAIAVLLAGCFQPDGSSSQAMNIQEKKWVPLVVNGVPTVPGIEGFADGLKNLTLTFQKDRIFGYDGCNVFGGTYTATATTLAVGEVGGTTRGCRAEILVQAEAYLNALEQVVTYRVDGDHLGLQDEEGRTILNLYGSGRPLQDDATV